MGLLVELDVLGLWKFSTRVCIAVDNFGCLRCFVEISMGHVYRGTMFRV